MSSSFGDRIMVQIFGQSHSEMLGVVMDGLPAGFEIDSEKIQSFLDRRKGGQNVYSTKRSESDMPRIVSGVVDGKTCGAPLCAVFENRDVKSADYEQLRDVPRPSHADLNAFVKYSGANDIRGGGHFSGRLTLPLCFAGAVCIQILEKWGIKIGAHIQQISDICDTRYDPVHVCEANLVYTAFPTNSMSAGQEMINAMTTAAGEGDSLGGIIECAALGMPQGVGEPMFDGLENRIAAAVFAIPAVKGVEFGAGFSAATASGSRFNDEYIFEGGRVKTKTNNSGGILGGISTGMPVIFRAAIKPTPSIAKAQNSVNIRTGEEIKLEITGRHDPCIVPRAVPCVEAAAAIAILDLLCLEGIRLG